MAAAVVTKLNFNPGIVRDRTDYANSGGWYDSNKIRFRLGFPETIGGWVKSTTNTFLGTCRCLHQWTSLSGVNYTGVGTNKKLYIESGGTFYDITPLRRTVTLAANPFTTQSVLNGKLTVTDASNDSILGDFVTFSGATAFDNYTTGMLNAEFEIVEILSVNTYTVEVAGVTSAGAGVSGGGAAVVAAYQINTGPDTQVFGTGWGTGTYGRGTWGSATTSGVGTGQLRLWSMDNFGEDLVACVRGGGIYYWTENDGLAARAVALSALSGSNQAPTIAAEVFVSDIDRCIVLLAPNEQGSSTQDMLLIRWSSTEDALEWEPRRDTTAGGTRLSSGSQIISALRAREETVIWTDRSLYTMSFAGPPYTFGFTLMGESTSIVGPNAGAEARNTVFWMDINEFKSYNGSINTLPSSVQNYVFDDINLSQRYKIVSGTNVRFNEIWWLYPSADSDEVDRYVAFNYVDNLWFIGTCDAWSAWWDTSFSDGFPLVAHNNYLYVHEFGTNADGEALEPFIEGSDMEIGEGDRYTFIKRLLPDITFTGTNETASVVFKILRRNFPGQSFSTGYSSTVMADTEESFVRVRAREFALRVESAETNMAWRLGTQRLDLRVDGGKS